MTVTVNIHEAKTHLSRLVEQAAKGQEFVIAKAGRPMVRVVPLEAPPAARELGFLAGQGVIDLDVKGAFADDVRAMFEPAHRGCGAQALWPLRQAGLTAADLGVTSAPAGSRRPGGSPRR